jgi:peroxiredoxin
LALTAGASAAERSTPAPVGERAPDVALGDQHGQPFRLADALKQRELVVLAFYVKAFTGG